MHASTLLELSTTRRLVGATAVDGGRPWHSPRRDGVCWPSILAAAVDRALRSPRLRARAYLSSIYAQALRSGLCRHPSPWRPLRRSSFPVARRAPGGGDGEGWSSSERLRSAPG